MSDLIKCVKCDSSKPISDFYLSRIRKSRATGECIDCVCKQVNAADQKPHRRAWFTSEEFKLLNIDKLNSYNAKYPRRYAVRQETQAAIKRGRLVKATHCEKCNSTDRIEAHHDDYNKALDVRWLCKRCHGFWHRYNTPVYPSN